MKKKPKKIADNNLVPQVQIRSQLHKLGKYKLRKSNKTDCVQAVQ